MGTPPNYPLRHAWEREAAAPLEAGRVPEIAQFVDRMRERNREMKWDTIPRDYIITRYSLLEARLAGMTTQRVFMSHVWDGDDDGFWYFGYLGREKLEYNFVEERFALPIRYGLVARRNAEERLWREWREWEGGEIPAEWLSPGRRKKGSTTPHTIVCIGEIEINQYLLIADDKEVSAYYKMASHFSRRRAA